MTVLKKKKESKLQENKNAESGGLIKAVGKVLYHGAHGAGEFSITAARQLLSGENHIVAIGQDTDSTTSEAAFWRYGEVMVTGVNNLLLTVTTKTTQKLLSSLTLLGHSAMTPEYKMMEKERQNSLSRQEKISLLGFHVGGDFISLNNFHQYKPQFEILSNHFEEEGYIKLGVCNMGLNTSLLKLIAKCVDVPIYSGIGTESAAGYNNSKYICVHPNGTVE